MNIELRFLQKAIEDKNYISFSHEIQNIKKAKPTKLINKDGINFLHCDKGVFDFSKVKKFKVLKERF